MNCLSSVSVAVDELLSIVGIISLVIAVIRIFWVFFSSNTEWASSISISEIKTEHIYEETKDGDCIFPEEYHTGESKYLTRLMFRPHDSIIRKITLSRVIYTNDNFTKRKLVRERVFQNITPQRPLIIGTEMAETFPNYVLSWKGDYGITAEYYFCMNGRDGNYQSSGMTYRISLWAKTRKILGLK